MGMESENVFVPPAPMSMSDEGAVEAFRDARNKSREICSCGHPLNYHRVGSDGLVSCNPFKASCSCLETHPVMVTKDLRKFQFATSETGIGMDHALSKGFLSAKDAGVEVFWISTGDTHGICEKCLSGEKNIYPVAVDMRTKRPVEHKMSGHINRILCWDCVIELWYSPNESE